MQSLYSYTVETKRKSIKNADKIIMSVNLKYPVFKRDSGAEQKKGFAAKLNKFYADTAQKYITYLEKKGARKAEKDFKASGGVRTAFVMTSNVSYLDENYISVFTDISYYDGQRSITKRFSQLWDINRGVILPAGEILNINMKSKKYIKQIICDIAEKNLKSKNFTYFDNYKSIIGKSLNLSNYYLVPKGVAFYFNSGKLSLSQEICVFVIPYERIDGVIKLDFLRFQKK